MRFAGSLAVALLLQAAPCGHPSRGEARSIDLDEVERAHREVARRIRLIAGRVETEDPVGIRHEAGLPSCRESSRRRAAVDPVPAELVGTEIHFGPRPRPGTLHAVTRAASVEDLAGGVPATAELAERLRVRCFPSLVRILSEREAEIHESP